MDDEAPNTIAWHVTRYGEATRPPVLLLHGFLGTGEDWGEIAAGLKKNFQVLCPDLPYHGRTHTTSPVLLSCEDVADGLAKWMQENDIGLSGVVGYSMGGRIALHLALRHPERVNRLILESASPGIEESTQREQRRIHDARIAHELEGLRDEAELRAFLVAWYAQPLFETCALYPERLASLITRRIVNHPRALANCLRGMGAGSQESLWAGLPQLAMPTLLITGDLDRKFRLIAEKMAEQNAKIAVEVMAGAGHNVHWERPAGYTTLLNSFLHATGGALS